MKEDRTWANEIFAATLFEEDLAVARNFYEKVFELEPVFEDDNSCVFKIGSVLINLLKTDAARELVAPGEVGSPDVGSRAVYTIHVEDVDRLCEQLTARGVRLLNGPLDRPWGIRTASFVDPGGHVWEIAK
jgi:uncharacterized glyoxalase superfamily protein PhnB